MHKSLLVSAMVVAFAVAAPALADQKHSSKPTPEEARQLLAERQKIKEKFAEEAAAVTSKIGDLSKSGNLPTNDAAIALLKKYVDELAEVRDELKRLDSDIADINAYITGAKKSMPKLETSVQDLQKVKFSGYYQAQFRNSNEQNKGQSSFETRRARVNMAITVDPRATIRTSFDLAGGTNRSTVVTKDAFLAYELLPAHEHGGAVAQFGQQPIPMGYELARSDADREFPERAQYNQRYFLGERSRGLTVKYGLSDTTSFYAGIIDSMTTEDPEQIGTKPGPKGRLAGVAALRYKQGAFEAGISGLAGKRPTFTGNSGSSPEVDRQFVFVDAGYTGLFTPNLSLRGEVVTGRDRIPNATGAPTRVAHNLLGWHVLMNYSFNPRNMMHFRVEQLDPNTDLRGDMTSGYGVAYSYFLSPNAKITAAEELFYDGLHSRSKYNVTTLRVQFRF